MEEASQRPPAETGEVGEVLQRDCQGLMATPVLKEATVPPAVVAAHALAAAAAGQDKMVTTLMQALEAMGAMVCCQQLQARPNVMAPAAAERQAVVFPAQEAMGAGGQVRLSQAPPPLLVPLIQAGARVVSMGQVQVTVFSADQASSSSVTALEARRYDLPTLGTLSRHASDARKADRENNPNLKSDMTEPNESTQRVILEDAHPCRTHEFRITNLEGRMTEVEKMHNILGKLTTNVELLNDRVRLLLWVGGVIAGGTILAIIGAIAYVLTGQR